MVLVQMDPVSEIKPINVGFCQDAVLYIHRIDVPSTEIARAL